MPGGRILLESGDRILAEDSANLVTEDFVGGVDISAPAQSFTLAGQAPAAGGGDLVAAPAKAFTLAGQAPSVATGGGAISPAKAYSFVAPPPFIAVSPFVNVRLDRAPGGIHNTSSLNYLTLGKEVPNAGQYTNCFISCWFYGASGGADVSGYMIANQQTFRVFGQTADLNIVLRYTSTTGVAIWLRIDSALVSDGVTHHLMANLDCDFASSPAGLQQVWLDGVELAEDVDYSYDEYNGIDDGAGFFLWSEGTGGTGSGWAVGRQPPPLSGPWVGGIEHLYVKVSNGAVFDLDTEADRDKFYKNGWVYMGPTGERTGQTPDFFLAGDYASWNNNGAAGVMTQAGSWSDWAGDAIPSSYLGRFSRAADAPAVGGGGGAVSPAQAYTLAGGVPAVAGGASAAPPAQAYTITGPTPAAGGGDLVAAPAQAFTLAGPTPAVAGGAAVATPLEALTFTGLVPAAGGGDAITAPAQAFTFAGYDPDIARSGLVDAPAGSFTLNGLVPSVGTGELITVPLAAYTIAGGVPNVGTGVIVTVDDMLALALAGYAPSVLARAWTQAAENAADWTAQGEAASGWTAQGENSADWTAQAEAESGWTRQSNVTTTWTKQ